MQTSELLHFAFRARDPLALGRWYAELFEGQFFVHPVMSRLGIVIVKINHPEAVFNGLIEFWPWDMEWDGEAARVSQDRAAAVADQLRPRGGESGRRYGRRLSPSSTRRGIPHRLEPRATGFLIPVVDDPEGNMVELFPNIDHMRSSRQGALPAGAHRRGAGPSASGI